MKSGAPHRDGWIYVAPLLCLVLAAWWGRAGGIQSLEWKTLDWRTQIRAEHGQPAPDERLLVVGIGSRSTNNIEPWPFTRRWHAQLQKLIEPEAPRVLVWDIIFGNRVDVNGDPLDAVSDDDFAVSTRFLAERGIATVFAAVTYSVPTGDNPDEMGVTRPLTRIVGDRDQIYGDAHLEMPFPGVRESGYIGSVDAPRGAGGIVRRMPMIVRVGDVILPTLTLQAAMQYWGLEPEDVTVVLGDAIMLGDGAEHKRIPIDDQGMLLINYRYEAMQPGEALGREMPVVEYFDLLIDLHQKHVVQAKDARGPVALRDRIVLVGEFSTDSGATPRSRLSPLVLLHANVINNILQQDFVRRVPTAWPWLLMLALGRGGAVLSRRMSVWLAVMYTVGVVAAYLGWAQWAWERGSWWWPVVAPLTGFLALQFVLIVHRVLAEQRAKTVIRDMFGSYLSPVVVEQLVETKALPELGGVTQELTAYFSDIQGFSRFSEDLEASELVELLNEYLTACTEIIHEERGTLDKYIGDAVVAMFGAPVAVKDHAYRACVVALRVQDRLAQLREKWAREGQRWPEAVHAMQTRIGLNTGPCMIGNMGSAVRFNYTMMGDDVNLAARMETGAKNWGVFILVTEATRRAAEAEGDRALCFRRLGEIRVAGRKKPVPVHELVGWRDETPDHIIVGLETFERGLEAYKKRDWQRALELFADAAKAERWEPGRPVGVTTNPSTVYQQLVRRLMENPPHDDWDGVYEITAK